MEETDDALDSDSLDTVLTEAEEREAHAKFAMPTTGGRDPDLSDGGTIGGVTVWPDGKKPRKGEPAPKGRPVARRAWTYNGSETSMTLAWNPDGTDHDYGRRYLAKRFCLCCKSGGFKFSKKLGARCPNCVKNNCSNCGASTDTSKVHVLGNGKTVKGWIIPCNYLRKEDVPFPARFFGSVNCFLEACIRRDGRGFVTEEDMRMHAKGVHRTEYQIWMDVSASRKNTEVESLRNRLDALMAQMSINGGAAIPTVKGPRVRSEAEKQAAKDRMAIARAAKKPVAKPA